MKRILIFAILLVAIQPLWAQDMKPASVSAEEYNFKLYPTQNMWTFLKLDTRNGVIRQVQYSVKGSDYRFESSLNLVSLVPKSEEVPGRFELYPTQNTYNFILLDRISGQTYQVQWSTEYENRGIIPIE